MTKQALLAAREALQTGLEYAEEKLIEHDNYYAEHPATKAGREIIVSDITELRSALALIDAALAQPEWTMPEPAYMDCGLGINVAFDEAQMRAAFEAGRMAG